MKIPAWLPGAIFTVGLLPAPADTETVVVASIPPAVLEERLRLAPRDNRAREEAIRNLFAAAGCDSAHLEERKIRHGKWANVVCVLPGEDATRAEFRHKFWLARTSIT